MTLPPNPGNNQRPAPLPGGGYGLLGGFCLVLLAAAGPPQLLQLESHVLAGSIDSQRVATPGSVAHCLGTAVVAGYRGPESASVEASCRRGHQCTCGGPGSGCALADGSTGGSLVGRLLLKLAIGPRPVSLAHPFSTKQVALRLQMRTNPPSSPMKKLRFLLVMPVATLAWVGAAAFGPTPLSVAKAPGAVAHTLRAQSRIGTITWQGNNFLSAAQLTEALELQPGAAYSKEALDAKLHYQPDNSDVTSRYPDQGYLFFALGPVAKTQPDGTTDLLFTLHEGPTAQVNTIAVKGSRKVATADIPGMLPLHQGELFSRAKLIQSQRVLAESGFFDPTKIAINPQPDPARGLVNVEFVVVGK